jgi:hypothetical protein
MREMLVELYAVEALLQAATWSFNLPYLSATYLVRIPHPGAMSLFYYNPNIVFNTQFVKD